MSPAADECSTRSCTSVSIRCEPLSPSSTIGAIVDQIVDAHPARPSSANRALSPEIDAILGRMLRKEREERYASAAEAAADLLGAARALEARRAAGER